MWGGCSATPRTATGIVIKQDCIQKMDCKSSNLWKRRRGQLEVFLPEPEEGGKEEVEDPPRREPKEFSVHTYRGAFKLQTPLLRDLATKSSTLVSK